ncbi:MAG: exosortase C-terminal domain/associated protein EpsI, partial [Gammaproteobacteria bacterium]
HQTISVPQASLDVRATELRSRSGELLVYSWYEIDGVSVAGDRPAKLREAFNLLTGGGSGSALVAVATDAGDPELAEQRLTDFLAVAYEELKHCVTEGCPR